MREARIVIADPTPEEARRELGRCFPDADTYVVEAPSGRRLEVAIHGHAGYAADPLTLWKAVFPEPGPYRLGTAAEFAKAVALTPGMAFEEWFLEDLMDQAKAQGGSIRDLIRRVVADFIGTHGGTLTEPGQLERFERLLFDLRQGIRWSIGNPVAPAVERALRGLGFTDRDLLDWPGLAARLGMIDAELRATGRFAWPRVLELAARVPLTVADEAAMAIARQSAGQYLTPVLLRDGTAMHAQALARERELLRTLTPEAVAKQMHPREYARELYQKLGKEQGVARDWERVARTEMANARLRGAYEAEQRRRQTDDNTLLYRIPSPRACNTCLRLFRDAGGMPRLYTRRELEAYDAQGYNRGPQADWHPTLATVHPNCLPGDVVVSGGANITATVARRYEGELVVFRTASGHELACTPNHPILTERGWLRASLLHEGAYVLCGGERDGRMQRIEADDEYRAAPIEEVAGTFRRKCAVAARDVAVSRHDFHGDGLAEQIAVVWTNRLLRNERDSEFPEHPRERDFASTNARRATALATLCRSRDFFQRYFAPAGGSVGRSRCRTPLLCRAMLIEDAVRFGGGPNDSRLLEDPVHRLGVEAIPLRDQLTAIASSIVRKDALREFLGACLDRNAGMAQPVDNDVATNAKRPRDDVRSLASSVTREDRLDGQLYGPAPVRFTDTIPTGWVLDRVIRHETRSFQGLVYNMEAPKGHYFAAGIVVHNCSCGPVQVWTPALAGVFRAHASQWQQMMRDRGLAA